MFLYLPSFLLLGFYALHTPHSITHQVNRNLMGYLPKVPTMAANLVISFKCLQIYKRQRLKPKVKKSSLVKGWRSRQMVEQRQRPRFKPCHSVMRGIYTFSLWSCAFLLGGPVSSQVMPVYRLIGLLKLPLICREWMQKWENRKCEWVIDGQSGLCGWKGPFPCCVIKTKSNKATCFFQKDSSFENFSQK